MVEYPVCYATDISLRNFDFITRERCLFEIYQDELMTFY